MCGGRDIPHTWENANLLDDVILPMVEEQGIRLKDVLIIEGGAKGGDSCGRAWASKNKCLHSQFRANWTKYGKSAGFLRNKHMIELGEPDVVIAYPGGRGTEHTKGLAEKAGIPVISLGLIQ